MKMRSALALLLALLLTVGLCCGCSRNAPEGTESADEPLVGPGTINPKFETNREDFGLKLGYQLLVPEGAGNVKYYVIDGELGEMTFTLDNMSFTARIQSASKLTDISGLHYKWTVEEDCMIGRCPGQTKRYIGENEQVDLCLFFDVLPGITYSISTAADSLDGFDITAIAKRIFDPMQSEAG